MLCQPTCWRPGKICGAKLAQAEADALEHGLPHEAAALAKRGDFSAEGPALVYLITHAAYGAAKVGAASSGFPLTSAAARCPGQDGWTETVATGSIDLAATMTRICNLAVADHSHQERRQDSDRTRALPRG